MLIFRVIMLFWVTTGRAWHASTFKKRRLFLILQLCISPLSETLFCAPVSLRPPVCSDWSLHTCLTRTASNDRAALLYQFLCAKLTARHKLWECVTCWCSVMSQCHGIKSGTTGEAFQEQCFCGREELLLPQILTFLTLKIFYMHKNMKERRKIKKGLSMLSLHCLSKSQSLSRVVKIQRSLNHVTLHILSPRFLCVYKKI